MKMSKIPAKSMDALTEDCSSKLQVSTELLPVQILDQLPTECLLTIFEHLDFRSLVKVSATNQTLLAAAIRAFATNFNNSQTYIEADFSNRFSAQLLDSFGAVIMDFSFDPRYEHIVAKYCERKRCRDEIPFPNCKLLTLNEHASGEFVCHFREWFPNLQTLQILSTKVLNTECIEVHMPELRKFTISNPCRIRGDDKFNRFTTKNIKAAITLNPQLSYLSLHEDDLVQIDLNMLQFISQALPELSAFNFHFENIESNTVADRSICFNDVRMATFCVPDAIALETFHIQLDKLHKLTIISRERLGVDCLDFAGRYKCLTHLKIRTDDDGPVEIMPEHFARFANRLPNLEHFYIDLKIDSAADSPLSNFIAEFLRKSLLLKSLHIRFIPDQIDQTNNWMLWDKLMHDIDRSGINFEWQWSHKQSPYDFSVLSVDILFERKM